MPKLTSLVGAPVLGRPVQADNGGRPSSGGNPGTHAYVTAQMFADKIRKVPHFCREEDIQ